MLETSKHSTPRPIGRHCPEEECRGRQYSPSGFKARLNKVPAAQNLCKHTARSPAQLWDLTALCTLVRRFSLSLMQLSMTCSSLEKVPAPPPRGLFLVFSHTQSLQPPWPLRCLLWLSLSMLPSAERLVPLPSAWLLRSQEHHDADCSLQDVPAGPLPTRWPTRPELR